MNIEKLSRLQGRLAHVVALPVAARYEKSAIIQELVKSGVGAAFCLMILLMLNPSPYLGWPFAGIGLLFLTYFFNQAGMIRLRLHISDTEVEKKSGNQRQVLRWDDLTFFQLNFYPHGRKAESGNLVLKLEGGGVRLKVESTLDHFPTLLQTAAKKARERELEMTPPTLSNLEQLGL